MGSLQKAQGEGLNGGFFFRPFLAFGLISGLSRSISPVIARLNSPGLVGLGPKLGQLAAGDHHGDLVAAGVQQRRVGLAEAAQALGQILGDILGRPAEHGRHAFGGRDDRACRIGIDRLAGLGGEGGGNVVHALDRRGEVQRGIVLEASGSPGTHVSLPRLRQPPGPR